MKWISVKDKKPIDSGEKFLFTKAGEYQIGSWIQGCGCDCCVKDGVGVFDVCGYGAEDHGMIVEYWMNPEEPEIQK